jgi:hypothetical protein
MDWIDLAQLHERVCVPDLHIPTPHHMKNVFFHKFTSVLGMLYHKISL